MNASRGQSTGTGRESGLWKRVLVGALLTLAVLVLAATPFVRYGAVAGEEFSPDRFRRRTYHYWEIPFLHIQITPLKRQDETSDLESYLVQKKLIAPVNQAQPRWDLVRLRRAEFEAPPGDALILCRYLDQTNEKGERIWLNWTKDHPQSAAVFWPAVAAAARRELYVLIPELFHLAERFNQPGQLQRRLARHLAARYEEAARVQEQLGRTKLAEQWRQAARDCRAQAEAPLPPAAAPQVERETAAAPRAAAEQDDTAERRAAVPNDPAP